MKIEQVKKLSPVERFRKFYLGKFEAKFERLGIKECWIWKAGSGPDGYGQFGSPKGFTRISHRISYLLYVGPIPEGLLVCHKCDNPVCVNPKHLFVGTQADNIQDMINKGRKRVRPLHGEDNGMAILTPKKVKEIRCLWDSGKYRIASLARQYSVGWTTIYEIVHRESWKNVD